MNSLNKSKFIGIIPARYASSRFPGKPLALIGDRSMIQRVYEQALKSLDFVFVATDDERIIEAVEQFGGKAIMTSPEHASGTDRCSEAMSKIEAAGLKFEVVINIQGDEPFIKPDQIEMIKSCFDDEDVNIATLICQDVTTEDLSNPGQIKTVIALNGDALYFSRSAVPYVRDSEINEWTGKHVFYKHLGLYGYKKDILKKLTMLERSSLEIAESLEQNRWLENGYKIRTAISDWDSYGIDSPGDLARANDLFKDLI